MIDSRYKGKFGKEVEALPDSLPGQTTSNEDVIIFEVIGDSTANLTTGDKRSLYAPFDLTLDSVFITVDNAPTGADIIVNLKKNGASVTTTPITITTGEQTSLSSVTPVFSSVQFLKGTKITPSVSQVGDLGTGKDLKIYLAVTQIYNAVPEAPPYTPSPYNLQLHGTASFIPDITTLAAKLYPTNQPSIITAFEIIGSDVFATIDPTLYSTFTEYSWIFRALQSSGITKFIENAPARITKLQSQLMLSSTTITHIHSLQSVTLEVIAGSLSNLKILDAEKVTNATGLSQLLNTVIRVAYFPDLTTMQNRAFYNMGKSGMTDFMNLVIPKNTTPFGANEFNAFPVPAKIRLFLNNIHATSNGGGVDQYVQEAIDLGVTVVFVTNTTKPEAITNLSASTKGATTLNLNFTPPTAANGMFMYCVKVDGLQNGWFYTNEQVQAVGLVSGKTYKITVFAFDTLMNRSLVSNDLVLIF